MVERVDLDPREPALLEVLEVFPRRPLEIGAGMRQDGDPARSRGRGQGLLQGDVPFGHVGGLAFHEIIPVEHIRPEGALFPFEVLPQPGHLFALGLVEKDLGDLDAEGRAGLGLLPDFVPADLEALLPEPLDPLPGLDHPRFGHPPDDRGHGLRSPVDERQEEVELALVIERRDFDSRDDLHARLPPVLEDFGIGRDRVVVGDGDGLEPPVRGEADEFGRGKVAVTAPVGVDVEIDEIVHVRSFFPVRSL